MPKAIPLSSVRSCSVILFLVSESIGSDSGFAPLAEQEKDAPLLILIRLTSSRLSAFNDHPHQVVDLFSLAHIFSAFVYTLNFIFNNDVLGLIVFKVGFQDPMSKIVTGNEDDVTPYNWFGVKSNHTSNGHIVIKLQFLHIFICQQLYW
ncbi:uncharacterized protein LOC120068192 [Benincasa hispida]|uniref:uncharacterized protein LOC120068192 n=1 Tax=Benincasa hispida TaxID=102211 RepID=UPI0018FF435F|nr:uncharacterized protein LOC120068192 [Benincasa hispida]